MMFSRMSSPLNPAAPSEGAPSERLRHIGTEIETLMSQLSGLQGHKRAIERQLASIADQIHAHNEALTPGNIFLLLEIRGSAGVSQQLEQIAHILHEDGYGSGEGALRTMLARISITWARVLSSSLMTGRCWISESSSSKPASPDGGASASVAANVADSFWSDSANWDFLAPSL